MFVSADIVHPKTEQREIKKDDLKKKHVPAHYLIDSTILNAVNYFWGIMSSSRCPKEGTTTLMDVTDNFRS